MSKFSSEFPPQEGSSNQPSGQLNKQQQQAVAHTEGPLLIIAGAGAGKTKTLVARIAHLIAGGVAPENILAITFTNKAAGEMKERVEAELATDVRLNRPVSGGVRGSARWSQNGRGGADLPFVSTFHALGVHILRANAPRLNIPKHFSIYDRSDSKRAVRDALKEADYDPKQFEPGKVLGMISRAKGEALDVEQFQEQVRNQQVVSPVRRAAAEVWERYAKLLSNEKALDFDDLLLKTLQLLENDREVREHYQDLWKYIHIDEYQDTNHVQYRIAQILAKKHRNICVVGDVDQTIYSWRGAEIKNILTFEQDYPEAETVMLEENYRSTEVIIQAANRVIEKNQFRKDKRLFTQNTGGELITIGGFRNESEEAAYIANEAKDLIGKGVPAEEIAVLYRTNVQSRALEEAMLARDVPYQVLGTRFFERKEVKDVIGYIKTALNPSSITDFKRVVNAPTRGIGKATMMRMIEYKDHELGPKQRLAAEKFRAILENIRTMAQEAVPSELVGYVIRESGLDAALKTEGTDDAEERRANMYELANLARKYDQLGPEEGIEMLLSDAALASDQDQLAEKKDGVKLMTVHAAKGLEFDRVFVVGLEQDLFPQSREEQGEQEEERRLFYVAVTRARAKLYLTYAGMRTIFGQTNLQMSSEFLEDIDDTLAERDEPEEYANDGGLLDDDPIVRIEW
ncbi:MAG: UvrD-helicase domain-containing protein [Candidatus Paceibacterota bacterium]